MFIWKVIIEKLFLRIKIDNVAIFKSIGEEFLSLGKGHRGKVLDSMENIYPRQFCCRTWYFLFLNIQIRNTNACCFSHKNQV